jgi:hypothetical protein
MATTKKAAPKSTVKKPVAKKAPVKSAAKVKAVTAKPAPKKAAVKKSASSKATPTKHRSFRVEPSKHDFKTFKITRQTVYWVVIVLALVFAQLWILNLHVEVASLIEAQQKSIQTDY